MKKDKNVSNFMTIDEIRGLFRAHWGLSLKRSSVYFYIQKHGFPPSTGHGCPRIWERDKVNAFFAKKP